MYRSQRVRDPVARVVCTDADAMSHSQRVRDLVKLFMPS